MVGLAADDGVDDQRLLPGVPGAAGLGGARVDRGGREGDLPAEPQDALDERVPLRLVGGQRRQVLLEDVGGDAHEVDGLAQRQPLGQVVRGDPERLRGEPDRLAALAQPRHEVRDARLGHQQHARALVGGQPPEPRLAALHLGEAGGGEVAGGQLDAPEGGLRQRRRHVRQHGNSGRALIVAQQRLHHPGGAR